ncbi:MULTISPECIES: LysR family transcriptional regulator [Brenneria]|uniref:LysR family transcriptional regulator n=1 Tax=Brenneria nigrifluens DSM 30175 = ATCC 13028 TaxID=1121120 RepID=A0A2U1UNX0_9GAMM|nr:MULTISPECIES: LysR family transcriptional regulator [Brenneria]EHD23437.1 transcriptional regulator, LysR family [Brenneria sp. EniD312]PWC23365.1 LysR family transcriptional regulator [Brenneria nigrifluens DSM 30175 = ATCC 13028]QCR06364.1 LysR family transcriptional regulator [Brenneria nigrifluens DSM 30175 = ATCC 13028]
MNAILLKTFLTIVKAGSINKSAEELFVAQSTVTKRLQVLENELGFDLFERNKGIREIKLTEAGSSFLEIAEKWYDFFLEIETIKSNESRINITIGCLNSINFAIFTPLYRALINHESKMNVKIVTTHSIDIFGLIEKRIIDVGFSFSDLKSQNTMSFKLYSEPMVGLCLPSSILAGKEEVKLEQLQVKDEYYVRWDEDFERWHMQGFGRIHGFNAQFDNGHLIMNLLSHGTDWAIVPSSTALFAQKQHGCVSFRLAQNCHPPSRVVYMVMHKNQKKSTQKGVAKLAALLHELSGLLAKEIPDIEFYTQNIIESLEVG